MQRTTLRAVGTFLTLKARKEAEKRAETQKTLSERAGGTKKARKVKWNAEN